MRWRGGGKTFFQACVPQVKEELSKDKQEKYGTNRLKGLKNEPVVVRAAELVSTHDRRRLRLQQCFHSTRYEAANHPKNVTDIEISLTVWLKK